MKKFLDLRCSRRLTVEEGQALLDALPDEASPAAETAYTKILLAIQLATHTCPPAVVCPVCGGKNAMERRLRERAAVVRLKKAPELEKAKRAVVADARREAMESRPPLKLTKHRFFEFEETPPAGGAA